jgi:DNA polymerase iota
LHLRLALGSHLAHYIRTKLELEKGYTATVGISTNKLLAKLVGNTHKPNAHTTLVPPYTSGEDDEGADNVTAFIDDHEVGKIPGIGFKIAQKLRAYVLQRPADFDAGLVYGGTKETVLVRHVRTHPGINPEMLERILGGPGVPHGIGARVWDLLNGCDDTEVGQAREIPRQISIEDSYMRLDTLEALTKELRMLAKRLLERMHTDLLEEDDDTHDGRSAEATSDNPKPLKRWLAHPKTLRLSTRPRPPQNPDGSRNRSFARISKSAPMPTFVFNLREDMDIVIDKLLHETLLPLFRKLHPEKRGWNLSLVNVAATNIADAASEKGGVGRDIGKMFKRQDEVLKQWRVEEEPTISGEELVGEEPAHVEQEASFDQDSWLMEARQQREEYIMDESWPTGEIVERHGSEDLPTSSQKTDSCVADVWESEDEDMVDSDSFRCEDCGAMMPLFAMGAHYRWHAQM